MSPEPVRQIEVCLWLEELVSGSLTSTKQIADRERCSERSVRMTLSLAFLSPRIIQAIADGTLADGPGVSRLVDKPRFCGFDAIPLASEHEAVIFGLGQTPGTSGKATVLSSLQ
jgi:hypothetical protein